MRAVAVCEQVRLSSVGIVTERIDYGTVKDAFTVASFSGDDG